MHAGTGARHFFMEPYCQPRWIAIDSYNWLVAIQNFTSCHQESTITSGCKNNIRFLNILIGVFKSIHNFRFNSMMARKRNKFHFKIGTISREHEWNDNLHECIDNQFTIFQMS